MKFLKENKNLKSAERILTSLKSKDEKVEAEILFLKGQIES